MFDTSGSRAEVRNDLAQDLVQRVGAAIESVAFGDPFFERDAWLLTLAHLTIRELDLWAPAQKYLTPYDPGIFSGNKRTMMAVELVYNDDLAVWEFGLVERGLWERARAPWRGHREASQNYWNGYTNLK